MDAGLSPNSAQHHVDVTILSFLDNLVVLSMNGSDYSDEYGIYRQQDY
jgi:hypothetical protein